MDADLKLLRDHEEFKKLLAGLEAKVGEKKPKP